MCLSFVKCHLYDKLRAQSFHTELILMAQIYMSFHHHALTLCRSPTCMQCELKRCTYTLVPGKYVIQQCIFQAEF